MKTINLIEQNKMGTVRIYPNCQTSILLQKLMGESSRGKPKTFTESDIEILKKLDYHVEIEPFIPKGQRPPRIWKQQQPK